MFTLGINAVFHDTAAAIIRDGEVLAAAEEERFTHIKHGKRPIPFTVYDLPFHAIDFCLAKAGIDLREVDHVAYSFEPALLLGGQRYDAAISLPLQPSKHPAPEQFFSSWDPLSLAYVVNAPLHLISGVPHHLERRWRKASAEAFQWHFVEHHLAHAASAFIASPFETAAVLTLDGRGELATTSYHLGQKNQLERIGQVNMPHSLGLLYEEVTRYLGFLHSSDEYKVMALASFGKPTFVRQFEQLIELRFDGQYVINAPNLAELFGPPRERGAVYEQRHFDIAHSLQRVLESTVLQLVEWLGQKTAAPALCMAGGVALNCVMNSVIRDRGPFESVWVQPAAGDAGTALGAALWIDSYQRKSTARVWWMDHAYLGPSFTDSEIETFIKWTQVPYRRLKNIAAETAALLAEEKIVGWFQGAMEFGPRALGARSILASPRRPEMQERLNEIKDREDFRPVAPVTLEERAKDWFVNAHQAPFMLFVFDVVPNKADEIPAVRHVDGTARVQTVNRRQNPLYYDLLVEFERLTGVPVLVNTSFNTRGEPIVCTPRDAVECFWTSPLDALVIGSFLLEKKKTNGSL